MFDIDKFIDACEDAKIGALDYEIAEEGTNLDSRSIAKTAMKNAKAAIKEARSMAKSGDASGAKDKLDAAIKNLEETKASIDGMDPSIGSAIIGWFASGLIDFGQALLLSIPTFGLGAVVVELKGIIEAIALIVRAVSKIGKQGLTANDFNLYINKLKNNIDVYIAICKKAKSNIG